MLIDDVAVYRVVSSMIPESVDREDAEMSIACGEPESAIAGLLDEAFVEKALSVQVLDYVDSLFESGQVADMSKALRSLMQSSVA